MSIAEVAGLFRGFLHGRLIIPDKP
jgi:hypothetical protein